MAEQSKRAPRVDEGGLRFARVSAVRIAGGYAIAAALWILLSDRAVALLDLPMWLTEEINSAKGLLFVAVTASILYVLSLRQLTRMYALTESYTRIFANASGGIAIYRLLNHDGKDLVIEDVNPAMLELLGMTREQLVGRRMSSHGNSRELQEFFVHVRAAALRGDTQPFEVHVEATDTYVLCSVFRLALELWALRTTDLTPQHRAQEQLRRQEERIREAYVDVLDAVTGGKLVLVTPEELDEALGEPLDEPHPVSGPEQLSASRKEIREAVDAAFPGLGRCEVVQNPAGEALNNALKHAHGGEFQVFRRGDVVQVLVRDHGAGIDFRTLPKATLVPGFSTTATLGMGFTIMLQLADRVLVSTGGSGTTVVLEVTATPERQAHCAR